MHFPFPLLLSHSISSNAPLELGPPNTCRDTSGTGIESDNGCFATFPFVTLHLVIPDVHLKDRASMCSSPTNQQPIGGWERRTRTVE